MNNTFSNRAMQSTGAATNAAETASPTQSAASLAYVRPKFNVGKTYTAKSGETWINVGICKAIFESIRCRVGARHPFFATLKLSSGTIRKWLGAWYRIESPSQMGAFHMLKWLRQQLLSMRRAITAIPKGQNSQQWELCAAPDYAKVAPTLTVEYPTAEALRAKAKASTPAPAPAPAKSAIPRKPFSRNFKDNLHNFVLNPTHILALQGLAK